MIDQMEKKASEILEVSEIDREMVDLNQAMTRLVSAIAELETRLSSVLRPHNPISETDQKATSVETLTPLSETIREEQIVVTRQALKVEIILQRLGI